MVFDDAMIDWKDTDFSHYDWTDFYHEAKENIPPNAPVPRGNPVQIKKKKKPKDYFKCVLHRCNYPPGTSHYLVHKGLGFLNVFNSQAIFSIRVK
jgi:hypothetical protein